MAMIGFTADEVERYLSTNPARTDQSAAT